MHSKIRTVLVGLGNIGFKYDIEAKIDQSKTHADAIMRLNELELIGAIEKSKYNRDLFNKHYPDIKTLNDWDKIGNLKPQLIAVATPDEIHLEIMERVCKLETVNWILLEKPVAETNANAKIIQHLCKKYKKKCWVNFIRRCDPDAILIRDFINTECKGYTFKGNATYTKSILNSGTHVADLLSFWLGKCTNLPLSETGRNMQENKLEFKNGYCLISQHPKAAEGVNKIIINWNNYTLEYDLTGRYRIMSNEVKKNCVSEKKREESSMRYYQLNVYKEILRYIINKPEMCNLTSIDEAVKMQCKINYR